MNLKHVLLCLGLIAGSTLTLPSEAQASFVRNFPGPRPQNPQPTFARPTQIKSIELIRLPQTPKNVPITVSATAFCFKGSSLLECAFRPLTLSAGDPFREILNPFRGEDEVSRVVLSSNQNFRARVKRVVPEPATLSMLTLGALSLGLLRSRKQTKPL